MEILINDNTIWSILYLKWTKKFAWSNQNIFWIDVSERQKKDDSSGMVDKNNNILKFNEDSVKALKKQIDTNLL